MALNTFAGLQARVIATLHRSDIAGDVPDWITLCEAQMNRRLNVRRGIVRASATIAAEYVALPADFGGGIRAIRLTDGRKSKLTSISPEQMADLKDRSSLTGEPRHYAVVGQLLEFEPVPDGSYTAMMSYYQSIPPLSATNATNWVLAQHPDAYLYGTLVQSAPFLRDDPRLETWGTLFTAALKDINDQSLMESMGGNLAMSPGVQPA